MACGLAVRTRGGERVAHGCSPYTLRRRSHTGKHAISPMDKTTAFSSAHNSLCRCAVCKASGMRTCTDAKQGMWLCTQVLRMRGRLSERQLRQSERHLLRQSLRSIAAEQDAQNW